MHPKSRYERLKINAKKEFQRKKRNALRNLEDKLTQEEENANELVTYRKLGDLQEEYRRRSGAVSVPSESHPT